MIEKQILFSIDDAIREVSEVLRKDHQAEMLYVNLGQIIALYATKDIINRQLRYAYEDRMNGGTEYETDTPQTNCENCAESGSYKCTKCDGEMYYKDAPQTR